MSRERKKKVDIIEFLHNVLRSKDIKAFTTEQKLAYIGKLYCNVNNLIYYMTVELGYNDKYYIKVYLDINNSEKYDQDTVDFINITLKAFGHGEKIKEYDLHILEKIYGVAKGKYNKSIK